MNINEENRRTFADRFYKIFLLLLVILSILFFILAQTLNEEFFIKFSPDNKLKEATIGKIGILRIGLFIMSSLSLGIILLSLHFRSYIKLSIKKHQNILKNILLLTSIILIFLLIIEIALKIKFEDTTFGSGIGPNSLKFNVKYVHLNKDNMRDRDFTIEKPENTVRIVGLGDSYTFGSGIKNINDTYLKILEKRLNFIDNGRKYEVLNFGIPGKDTKDELEMLKEKALKYDPDIIMIGYVVNDFKNVDSNLRLPKKHLTIIPFIGFWLGNIFYSYALFEIKMNRAIENLGLKMPTTEITLKEFESEANKEYNKKLFKDIAALAKEKDIKVALVVFPVIYNLDNYPFFQINEFIKEVGMENNFYIIDILETYKGYEESELIVNKYDLHPNELGHKLIAQTILEKFIKDGVIE